MTDLQARQATGERRRDVGLALAVARRPDRVKLGRLAMVRAMLASAHGSRHRGYLARLRLVDREASKRYLNYMTTAIAIYDATPSTGIDGAAQSNNTSNTSHLGDGI